MASELYFADVCWQNDVSNQVVAQLSSPCKPFPGALNTAWGRFGPSVTPWTFSAIQGRKHTDFHNNLIAKTTPQALRLHLACGTGLPFSCWADGEVCVSMLLP